MRKYASAEERAAKNQKTTVCHFGFTEKVYGLPCMVRTMLLWKRHQRNAIVRISFFVRGAIAVEARRRRAASARIYIYTNMKPHKNSENNIGAPYFGLAKSSRFDFTITKDDFEDLQAGYQPKTRFAIRNGPQGDWCRCLRAHFEAAVDN